MTHIPPQFALRTAAIRAGLKIEDDLEHQRMTVMVKGAPAYTAEVNQLYEWHGDEWSKCSLAHALTEVHRIAAKRVRVSQ